MSLYMIKIKYGSSEYIDLYHNDYYGLKQTIN